MPPRQRLTPDARRDQILTVAARLFAERSYDDVLMEDVATRAGISRALLYRHFPGKRELFAALYRQVAAQLLERTRLDPADTLVEQLTQGLDAHIEYFAENRNTVLAANRVLAGDRAIQTIMTDELAALRERLLGALPLMDDGSRRAVSGVLNGWLVFVQVLCVDWLTEETCTRAELRDVCIGAVLGAIRPLLDEDPAPDWPRSGMRAGTDSGTGSPEA
ncbi:HTH-type transcriptional repressor KstR2 [Streptomyces sp. YIM 130001]|uniref:TetR/AcrR family transcriptional regulator n=1 Tax=Streptomyces sp. YIM 130001 TaxID=2259644 RepID=UPI000E657994|nr:TetR/AcrR family transcriptional regulator [Streptomyces sp. YIM 130001]RII18688.1 HTH-type transcriptional repressor KstR2 [Streptomyces sp. YIM 130001]